MFLLLQTRSQTLECSQEFVYGQLSTRCFSLAMWSHEKKEDELKSTAGSKENERLKAQNQSSGS